MTQHSDDTKQFHMANRFRASQLIGCKITNARDEALGSVQDIVLTNDDLDIAYAVVAFGGFLGMGEKHFAMPWRTIKTSRNSKDGLPRISLAIDQGVLEAAPGFAKDQWPDMADTTWARKVDDFYSARAATSDGAPNSSTWAAPLRSTGGNDSTSRDPDGETFQYRRVSQLLGMEVVGVNRETLAEIDDLVLDADGARIEGAALSFGGLMGMGKHIALVPVESLALDRGNANFGLPCTKADLEALELPGGDWPVLDNDEWLIRGRQQCDRVPKAGVDRGSAAAWDA